MVPKKVLNTFFLVLFIIASFFIPSIAMATSSDLPQVAPVNPEFEQFLQDSKRLFSATLDTPSLETSNQLLGSIPSPVLITKETIPEITKATFDRKYDLRDIAVQKKLRLTPIRDQGGIGACWAFGAYSSLESYILSSTGQSLDFSENNLLTQSGFDYGPNGGGNRDMSTAYMARWGGPVLETADPYANPANPANIMDRGPKSSNKHVQEVLYLPARTGPTDNNDIKAAVMQYGAVSSSMYWGDAYYNSTNKSFYNKANTGTNHIVAIVGWDDDFLGSKFNGVAPGPGAFIVRNSWGTGWGENGYFYISYYDKSFGNYNNTVYENAENPQNYGKVYQYDPLGMTGSIGYSDNIGWFANVFIASAKENLGAVSFYTNKVNVDYEIYVESNYDSNGFGKITETKVANGTLAMPGYHTVKVNTPVALTNGQKYAVAVKLVNPSVSYPIPIESKINYYTDQASAHVGESFISHDGTFWTDLQNTSPNANVCLKAFTISGPVIAVEDPFGEIKTVANDVYNYDIVFSVTDTVGLNLPVVTANGTGVGVSLVGGKYHAQVSLNTGTNTIILIVNNINGDISSQTVTISRSASIQPDQLQFSAATYLAMEGASAGITVSRSGEGLGAVTVAYATDTTGTATSAVDFTPTSGVFSFADGEMSKTFFVPILPDKKIDPNETVGLVLSSPTGGALLGSQTKALITIKEGVAKISSDLPRTSFDMMPGSTLPLHITATFADNNTGDVTNSLTWKSTKPLIATVSDGVITTDPNSTGIATLSTTYGGKPNSITVNSSMKSLILTRDGGATNISGKTIKSQPNDAINLGLTANFGKDAATQDLNLEITNLADWVSSRPEVATVFKGLVTNGTTPGVTKISATYLGKAVVLTIDTSVKSLSITQGTSTTNLSGKMIKSQPGAMNDIVLTANFGKDANNQDMLLDVTNLASWGSSIAEVALISSGHIINGSKFGVTKLTGTYGGKSATVSTDTTVQSLSANIATKVRIKPSTDLLITLTANFGKDTSGQTITKDVTTLASWTSSKTTSTVLEGHIFNSAIPGSTVITAVYGGKKFSVTIDTTVSSIAIYKEDDLITNLNVKKLDLKPGTVNNYIIRAFFGKDIDGKDLTTDVSSEAIWSSNHKDIADMTVVGSVYQIGAVADMYGLATIKATYGGKSVTLNVNTILKDIVTNKTTLTMTSSTTAQLSLTATYADGTMGDVTSKALWSVTGTAASVSDSGVVTASIKGSSVITVKLGGKTKIVRVIVT